jgi:hypothetical protein
MLASEQENSVTDHDPMSHVGDSPTTFEQPLDNGVANGNGPNDMNDMEDMDDMDDMSGAVRADHVEICQGGASSVEATTVSIRQGGAGRIQADEITISQGGAGLVQTDSLKLEEGATAFAVLAGEATVSDGASVFVLLARSVSGGVRPVLDWRAAAAFGAGFGAAFALLRRRS